MYIVVLIVSSKRHISSCAVVASFPTALECSKTRQLSVRLMCWVLTEIPHIHRLTFRGILSYPSMFAPPSHCRNSSVHNMRINHWGILCFYACWRKRASKTTLPSKRHADFRKLGLSPSLLIIKDNQLDSASSSDNGILPHRISNCCIFGCCKI